jgi:protein-disulfide isomerase
MNRTRSRSETKKQAAQSRSQAGLVVIGVGAIILVIGLIFLASNASGLTDASANPRLALDAERGDPDAPVTITEYASYGCPACQQWHRLGIIEDLLQEYDGQVRFVYRFYPVIQPAYDEMSAEVAECVLDQGQDAFWAFHGRVYADRAAGQWSRDELVQLAGAVGADAAAVQACVDAGTHTATVAYHLNRGRGMGLRGAPAFEVNGRRLYDQSPDGLRAAVDAALQAAGA